MLQLSTCYARRNKKCASAIFFSFLCFYSPFFAIFPWRSNGSQPGVLSCNMLWKKEIMNAVVIRFCWFFLSFFVFIFFDTWWSSLFYSIISCFLPWPCFFAYYAQINDKCGFHSIFPESVMEQNQISSFIMLIFPGIFFQHMQNGTKKTKQNKNAAVMLSFYSFYLFLLFFFIIVFPLE